MFQKLIKDSEKGNFNAVIMYTLDRFARNRYDSAIYKAKLKKNGVRVFYAKQPMPDTPEGIILESVLEGYAEYYSENLARSIRRGLKENALKGIAMGTPALGYKVGENRQFVVDPVGAKAVEIIFNMYSEGYSATEIITYLNNQGYKTSRGNAFNKNSLNKILKNDKYIGTYRYNDVVLENHIPPIISKNLFEKVQSMLKHNFSSRAKNKAKEDYLLTTKIFCGHCNEPMIGESGTSHTGKTYHYYKCAGRKRNKKCNKAVEKKDFIEQIVVKHTVKEVLTDKNIELIANRTMEFINEEMNNNSLLLSLKEKSNKIDKKINNIMSAIEQGIFTQSTKARLEELEDERQTLEEQIAREEIKKPFLTKERIIYWLHSFKNGDIKNKEYQCRIIDTLVNRVFVYDTDNGKRNIVVTFNLSENNTSTITSSDIESLSPLECAYPNRVKRRRQDIAMLN